MSGGNGWTLSRSWIRRSPSGASGAASPIAASNGTVIWTTSSRRAESRRAMMGGEYVELQKQLASFRAHFETDIRRKTILDNEALRVKNAGVEERALKAGQRAPDFALPDMAGKQVSLAQL